MTAHPILVIGATGGIGEALARRLHAHGASLHLLARNADKVAALAGELGATHDVVDVLDHDALARAIELAAASGGLKGLAFCVGSIVLKPLKQARAEDYRAAFELNLVAAALAIRAAQPALAEARGSVVLFSTVAARQGFANHAVIAAAKGAVEGLALALAAELAPAIRVNVIAPSLTRTPLAESFTRNPAMVQAIADLHALRRIGEADDAAALAAFLLSDEAGWITGQVIGVDGGRSSLRTKG